MAELPSGTVTLLFTDIEGSTRMLQELGRESYVRALTEHRRLLREAFTSHGGVEVEMQGDSFFFAFTHARDAVAAAEEAQRSLAQHAWEREPILVRIGIHTGEPIVSDGLYAGLDVHRAARVMSAGHGGQVLVSQATRELVGDDFELRDLGAHRLKDLAAPVRLYQAGTGAFPAPKSLNQTNLPIAASPLIGREHELDEIVSLLGDGNRLVTVTGAGGTGKTRLALQAAAELAETFADGVFWVPLVAVSDSELVLPAVVESIDARGPLREYLREKELLLLLDNAERVVESAPALAELLAGAPKLRLLVTSRTPLHISPEHEFPLEPLPPADAATLFVERARSAGRRFDPDGTIEAICRRVDGLPLAIELAAARTRVLAPETLLARLDHALPLLRGGARDAPERHRTLEATIDWSYDLLDDDAKRILMRLSVFSGTFSVEAAEQICNADLGSLEALVDLALVKPLGSSRLLLLETIREYAALRAEDAGETGELLDRHGEYYLQLAADAVPGLRERNAGPAIASLAEEITNVRAALWHVAAADPDRALRATVDLTRFWNARSPGEPLRLLRSLYREDLHPGLRREALGALAFFAWNDDEVAEAERYKLAELSLARELGDIDALVAALPVATLLARGNGGVAAADRLTAECETLANTIGDRSLLGKLYWYRGSAELMYGDPEAGLPWCERALAECTSANDENGTAWARFSVGDARCRLGHWKEARRPLQEALLHFHSSGEWKALANSVDHLAGVAAATGYPGLAAQLRGAADALWTSIGVPLDQSYRPSHIEEAIASARTTLGDDAYERERYSGETMSLDDLPTLAGDGAAG